MNRCTKLAEGKRNADETKKIRAVPNNLIRVIAIKMIPKIKKEAGSFEAGLQVTQ
jgi:hypothetical protein